MQPNPLYAQCIRRAARLLGGYRALGESVGVAPRLLERWGAGQAPAPQSVFLKIVDVLLEKNLRAAPPPRGAKQGPGVANRS